MLNLLSPIQPSPPPPLPRRRGGQPSNRNALIHGLYAVKNPSPLLLLPDLSSLPDAVTSLHEPRLQQAALGRFGGTQPDQPLPAPAPLASYSTLASLKPQTLEMDADAFSLLIMRLRLQAGQLFQALLAAERPRLTAAYSNQLSNTALAISRLGVDRFLQERPRRDLHSVAKHALAYILNDFRDQGIFRDTGSFQKKDVQSDFNSASSAGSLLPSLSDFPCCFISPRQRQLLAPLLPSPERTGRTARTGRRGRPPADPFALLDAIFWKLAHHACWQDLPEYYPPMLTCRRYYRRLFLSGRLATFLDVLFKDFQANARLALTDLVERRYFIIQENKITLAHGLGGSPHLQTPLLFMQMAYQGLRRTRRRDGLGSPLFAWI